MWTKFLTRGAFLCFALLACGFAVPVFYAHQSEENNALATCQEIKENEISQFTIHYTYRPKNTPEQEIFFTVRCDRCAAAIKQTFVVKSVRKSCSKEINFLKERFRAEPDGSSVYGIDSDTSICSSRDKEPSLWWEFNFFGRKEVLITRYSRCFLVELADDSLYQILFDEILSYHKKIFPNSTKEEISFGS